MKPRCDISLFHNIGQIKLEMHRQGWHAGFMYNPIQSNTVYEFDSSNTQGGLSSSFLSNWWIKADGVKNDFKEQCLINITSYLDEFKQPGIRWECCGFKTYEFFTRMGCILEIIMEVKPSLSDETLVLMLLGQMPQAQHIREIMFSNDGK